MCGRYFIASEYDESEIKKVVDQLKEKYKNTPALSEMKTGEIYPSDIVPAVTAVAPVLMKWGFPRFDGKGLVINARLETADEKPMFRKSFAGQRCLLPASRYFEWEKTGTAKRKYSLGLREPIYLAGLYRLEPTLNTPSFVILTRPAAEGIAFIHDRMPVILSKETHEQWLSGLLSTREVLNFSLEDMDYRDA